MDNQQHIQDLLNRIDRLNKQLPVFQSTIDALKKEVQDLSIKLNNAEKSARMIANAAIDPPVTDVTRNVIPRTEDSKPEETIETPPIIVENRVEASAETPQNATQQDTSTPFAPEREENTPPQYQPPLEVSKSLEAFIGENLASKVGIIITVLGIGIGVKYAIDHDLISYWGRIILGYLAGCGLLEVAFKLRQKDEKYEDLSNIILGGGFASVFFVTYAAYSFYGLMPQAVAFGLMVVIAAATVVAALKYNQQLIAVGGLVGAYSIPFLLSTGEDKPITLFAYIAIINTAILVVSFKRDWRILYYLAFVITWWLFGAWSMSHTHGKMMITSVFLSIFFVQFYTIFIAYKFIKNEAYSGGQMSVLLFNSLFFYGIGYQTLDINPVGEHYLGVFTLLNALIHLIISKFVYERNLADTKLFNWLSRFGIFFITLAIIVQFNGTTVTMLLAAEMALLFWIGRTKDLRVYEVSTYPLWVLTSLSLIHDWLEAGYFNNWLKSAPISPIFNLYFLTTLLVMAAFLFILKLNADEKDNENEGNNVHLFNLLAYILVFFLTMAIVLEFNGTLVTILLAAEMTFLFWIGRAKKLPVYETATYILWVLGLFSLGNDLLESPYLRATHYGETLSIPLFANIYFFTTAILIAAFIVIRGIHLDEKHRLTFTGTPYDNKIITFFLTAIILVLSYFLFYNEIANYFSWKYADSIRPAIVDANIARFKNIWLINYSLLFMAILNAINLKNYKSTHYALIGSALSLVAILMFLTNGLYTLGTLKNAYLYNEKGAFYYLYFGGLFLRYISYILVAGLLFLLRENKKAFFIDDEDIQKGYDIALNVTLLWVLSSEMVHWLELSSYTQAYKWAISVLFGIYALGLILYGIKKKKKYLRVVAIGLFILTLIKVFVFDLMGLDTIAKTIVMISLGVLLLIVSFLYTKFKDTLLGDEN